MRVAHRQLKTVYPLIIAVLSASLTLTAACSLVDPAPTLKEVGEHSGLFHVKVPQEWQTTTARGVTALYASSELPSDPEAVTELSMLIFTADVASQTPVPVELSALVGQRAVERGWQEHKVSAPETSAVGEREASRVHVTLTSASGQDYEGDFYLARTSGREVLIVATAPLGSWTEEAPLVEDVLREWYWHVPE